MRPNSATICLIAFSQSSGFVNSATTDFAIPPAASISLMAIWLSLSFLPIITGIAPSEANTLQIPKPIPLAPPVTMIILFSKFKFIFVLFYKL